MNYKLQILNKTFENKEEENETVTNCDQLKLLAKDGKYRNILSDNMC